MARDEYTTTAKPTHTADGASTDWGPCVVCGATDEIACPNCPGEVDHQIHSLAFKAGAASDPGAMTGVLARAAHENNHLGEDVCINCVNLRRDGTVIKRTG